MIWIAGVAGSHSVSVTIDAILRICAYLAFLASVILNIENLVGVVFSCAEAIASRETTGVIELAEEAHLIEFIGGIWVQKIEIKNGCERKDERC